MSRYLLVTYDQGVGNRTGILRDGLVTDIATALDRPACATMQLILDAWDEMWPALNRMAADSGTIPVQAVRLHAPLPGPLAIYCVGANYPDHVANMAKATGHIIEQDPRGRGMPPWFFLKTGRSVTGPEAKVLISGGKLDWEAELAVVIGRKAREVRAADALDYVAGYTIANDLSARDRIFRRNGDPASPFFLDFVAQKNFDGACPMGPGLIPAHHVDDPQALGIKLWVNDRLRTDANTRQMTYSIAEQIAHLSSFITLHPGDIVLTGTGAGVGAETGEFLQVGDVVRIEIETLGTLKTFIV